ncbi:MAG: putative rane protein [Ilumatobacteraceae bacterium]|nr:putative rane protein [Ilumatobacteraceae bacterium]
MTDISVLAHVGAAAAAVGAGLVNAIAGGGTLISFPVMTAIGVPSVRANATNTVSLLPGYLGGVSAQRDDLKGEMRSVRPQLVAAALGGLLGSILLIVTSESVFRAIVPFLILASALLLGIQDRLRSWIFKPGEEHRSHVVAQVVCVGLAGVYGGYFGAGLGIMLIAVLGMFSDLPLNRLNAIKLLLAFVVNLFAAAFLSTSGKVEWSLVLVMAPAALLGGNLGGRLAKTLPPKKLRAFVIVFGVVVAIIYFFK